MLDERCTSTYAHSRAASQKDFLQGHRTVVIVGQVRAGSRSSGGLEELLPPVTSVVNLHVPQKDFGQVHKQLGTVSVLGVHQQAGPVRNRLALPGTAGHLRQFVRLTKHFIQQ